MNKNQDLYKKIDQAYRLILPALFFGFLVLSMVELVFQFDPTPTVGEVSKGFPKFTSYLRGYFQDVGNYMRSNFGFRKSFICLYNANELQYFKTPWVGKVVIGKDGTLFYGRPDIADDFVGKLPFKDGKLDEWKNVLLKRSRWLKSLGIPYYIIVAPNNHDIYPEALPPQFGVRAPEIRIDKFLKVMKSYPEVNLIDLKPFIMEVKQKSGIWHKHDTHWSSLGAYYGYKAFMENLIKPKHGVAALPLSSFKVEYIKSHWHALSDFLCLGESAEETMPSVEVADYIKQEYPTKYQKQLDALQTINPKVSNYKVLVFRDSFGTHMRPFFASTFSKVLFVKASEVYHQAGFDPTIVIDERPDIVISIFLQTALNRESPPKDAEFPNISLH